MKITHAQVSTTGPVRETNEDFIVFWQPPAGEVDLKIEAAAILADGVGGGKRGDLASRLAATAAAGVVGRTKNAPHMPSLMRQIFTAASREVYEEAQRLSHQGQMSTTLTVSLLHKNVLHVGYVGDSRTYLVRKGKARRLTTDHSYVSLPVKLRLVQEHRAMANPMRSVLTRSVGLEPAARFDTCQEDLFRGDLILQCTDGLHGFVLDDEIGDIVSHFPPDEACQKLIALTERRQGDDNVSIQIIRIDEVDLLGVYRGVTIHGTPTFKPVGNELEPGGILDDKFEITEVISHSGMATIFKGRDRKTGQTVAIKVPLTESEGDPATYARFQREEEIGRQLDHPYILKIFPVEGEKSRPYIVMEFLDGQTLDKAMQANQGPFREPDAARIASRICEALDYMHRNNVVHRDLKPQNIMLCNDGTIRILDFGIAKAARMRRITFAGFSPTMGTPDYMAPEQVRGRRGDHRTDIYSLGAILYEMVTGKVPFEGEGPYAIMNARTTGDPVAPREINDRLTPVMEEIILHALSREPDQRFADAAAMKRELDDYETVELIGRYKTLQPAKIWKGRFRMLPLIIFFVILLAAQFFGMLWYFTSHGKH